MQFRVLTVSSAMNVKLVQADKKHIIDRYRQLYEIGPWSEMNCIQQNTSGKNDYVHFQKACKHKIYLAQTNAAQQKHATSQHFIRFKLVATSAHSFLAQQRNC